MAKRIGVCRTLHTYHHYALWKTLLTELGWEVVLSGPTSRAMLDQGVRLAPSELCLPVKAFLGHVAELKDGVDALFLPRIVCSRLAGDWFFGCPKAIALPDLTRAVFDALPSIVEPVLDAQQRTTEESYRFALSGRNHRAAFRELHRRAATVAEAAAERTRAEQSPLHMFSGTTEDRPIAVPAVRIGVVGHPYLLFDPGLSLNLLKKIREAGAEPVVIFPTDTDVEEEARREDALNWCYELELLAAARRLLERERVDGLLLVASFACGTGAVTNELIHRAAVHRHGRPTVLLILDEHTGESGLVTRVESFVDLLRMKRP